MANLQPTPFRCPSPAIKNAYVGVATGRRPWRSGRVACWRGRAVGDGRELCRLTTVMGCGASVGRFEEWLGKGTWRSGWWWFYFFNILEYINIINYCCYIKSINYSWYVMICHYMLIIYIYVNIIWLFIPRSSKPIWIFEMKKHFQQHLLLVWDQPWALGWSHGPPGPGLGSSRCFSNRGSRLYEKIIPTK